MFKWLSKRKDQTQNKNIDNDNLISNGLLAAAGAISLQLSFCSAAKNIRKNIFSDAIVIGYIFGMFDAALQVDGTPIKSDEHFFQLIIKGCSLIDYPDKPDDRGFMIIIRDFIKDPNFLKAQIKGGEEYFSFIRKNTNPLGLTDIILGRD